jgi:hypothetical protein
MKPKFLPIILIALLITNLTFQNAFSKGKKKHKSYKKSSYTASYKCGSKRYCSQMTSCKEAKYYLNVCGLKKLDRDRDGIPCEKLCK